MNTALKLQIEAPVIKLQPRQDPFVISHDIMKKCAAYIKDNADADGYFKGEFLVEDKRGNAVEFDISCRLYFMDDKVFSETYYYASAYTCDEDGNEIPTDFSEAELSDYLEG